jgi:hypothetical protein
MVYDDFAGEKEPAPRRRSDDVRLETFIAHVNLHFDQFSEQMAAIRAQRKDDTTTIGELHRRLVIVEEHEKINEQRLIENTAVTERTEGNVLALKDDVARLRGEVGPVVDAMSTMRRGVTALGHLAEFIERWRVRLVRWAPWVVAGFVGWKAYQNGGSFAAAFNDFMRTIK